MRGVRGVLEEGDKDWVVSTSGFQEEKQPFELLGSFRINSVSNLIT